MPEVISEVFSSFLIWSCWLQDSVLVICWQRNGKLLCSYKRVESWWEILHTWCEGVKRFDGSKIVFKSNLVKPGLQWVQVTGATDFLLLQLGMQWLSFSVWLPSATKYGWSHVKGSKAIGGREETGRQTAQLHKPCLPGKLGENL